MGRTLQNTMVNLALENACDEATYQVRQHQCTALDDGLKPMNDSIPCSSAGSGHGRAAGDGGRCWTGKWRPWSTCWLVIRPQVWKRNSHSLYMDFCEHCTRKSDNSGISCFWNFQSYTEPFTGMINLFLKRRTHPWSLSLSVSLLSGLYGLSWPGCLRLRHSLWVRYLQPENLQWLAGSLNYL